MVDRSSTDDANEIPKVISDLEKESRNKRKFLSEFPPETPGDAAALSLIEFPRYELLEEKLRNSLNELESLEGGCPQSNDKQGEVSSPLADWEDPMTCQLEELLSDNLSATFRSAVKKIVECGCSEEVAVSIILRSGLYHGGKDAISNIVDGALPWLSKEIHLDTSKDPVIPDLPSLVKFIMLEMIYVLREVKPALTVVEAMWCLLMCDLNLFHACTAEGDLLVDLYSQGSSGDSSSVLQPKTEASEVPQSNTGKSQLSKPSVRVAQTLQSKVSTTSASAGEPNSRNPPPHQAPITGKGGSVPLPELAKSAAASRELNKNQSKTAAQEDKSGAGKKVSSLNSKKDLLRQKTFHFEKNYKGRMGKGAIKAKLSAWGSMVLDKTLNSQSGPSGAATKSSYSAVNTSIKKSNNRVAEGCSNCSCLSKSITPVTDTSGKPHKHDTVSPSPAVNKKAPASTDTEPKSSMKAPGSTTSSSSAPNYYAGIPYDESQGKYIPRNERDETILLLTPYMETLQKEIQRWSDWANEKVKQAARRLGKDQAELKILRHEKEESENFQKNHVVDENTIKRLSEMENALSNASGQIEMATSTLHRLEEENTMLKQEMEASKLSATGSVTNLHKALAREQETLKKYQGGEVEKHALQEEFSSLKHVTADSLLRLEKAKKRLDHFEVLWKQEEREKQRFLEQAASFKAEREQLRAHGKVEEDSMREKAKSYMLKCKEEMEKLESEISELRLMHESSQIEALKRAIHGVLQPPKFDENFGSNIVKMERECVMCMSEEMSVVFLPCAHQVLCAKCSVLHSNQGMNDCPSCRTPIKKRVKVRFANS